MILYLDSSALVKLLIEEEASALVAERVRSAEGVLTSRVAYPEACAAIGRRRREGLLEKPEFQTALRTLKKEWPTFGVVELDEILAGELALRHGLKGFDAVHVAAAIQSRRVISGSSVIFLSFDLQQARAARLEKFQTIPEKG